MKKQFVTDLKPGDFVNDVFVLSEKNIAQKRDGNDYLTVTLSDKTGSVKGVVWGNVDQIATGVSSGDFVQINASVSEYKNAVQLVIRKMASCAADRFDPAGRYSIPESLFTGQKGATFNPQQCILL